tara:strand:- start:900 stop:1028 length:129 start_codon:yes stop_codon:yes gene_type:complete
MNVIAGWLICMGLLLLGRSVEKSAEIIVEHKCEAAHNIKEKT